MSETKPDKRERITGRLRHALDLMVWGNETGKPLDWDDAARNVNISARSMRKSLERLAVRQYLTQQRQVLRSCLSAKNLRHLDELASQRVNMNAAVAATKVIEQLDAEAAVRTNSDQTQPGVVIRILNVTPPALPPVAIDVTPSPLPDLLEQPPAGPFRPDR